MTVTRTALAPDPVDASPRAPGLGDYSVLGGVLRSSLHFPELDRVEPSASAPDWALRVARTAPPPVPLVPVGERRVGEELYRLWRTPSGFRLEYSHAGLFDVNDDGVSIVWYPAPDARLELARAIVLGPALSLALELRGHLCLHGSAVALPAGVVAFLGGKHHGKSTLATALTSAGARLVGDDLLAVSPGPPVRVRAGVASVRLWGDAAARLDVASVCDTVIPGVKVTARGFAGRVMTEADAPLVGIYLLAPVPGGVGAEPCRRTPLAGAAAAIALARQTKLPDSLVGARGAGMQLRAAAATASSVPIWTLDVVRDFSLLDAVVERILTWHSA